MQGLKLKKRMKFHAKSESGVVIADVEPNYY
jgi:hypothetical protein